MSEFEKLKAELEKASKAGRPSKPKSPASDYLSTGSTLLNLAFTGHPNRGFRKGHFYLFVGDSASGKTFVANTCLEEACRDINFSSHNLIYDDPEEGALPELYKFFPMLKGRIEPPSEDGCSESLDAMYFNIDHHCSEGPCIYATDSLDALLPDADEEKFQKGKRAHRRGKKLETGSYGTARAKLNSSNLNRLVGRTGVLSKHGSILILICQSRDAIGGMNYVQQKTRGGGRAPRFYATLEFWTSIAGRTWKDVRGRKIQTGIIARVDVKKNRFTGRETSVKFPIYWSYGIDDVGSMVDWLAEWKRWPRDSKARDIDAGKIDAKDFNVKGSRTEVIRHVEGKKLVGKLKKIVWDEWKAIEKAAEVDRPRRYK